MPLRAHYNVLARHISDDAWHLTVDELPRTWTVAFGRGEIEARARVRIALDMSIAARDFDITVRTVAR